MAGSGYRERVLDRELAERLSAIGAVLIEGPKACGKTESATQKAVTTYRLDVDPAARNAASVAADLLLDGPSPVLFDEWQVVPTLWDQVRRAVDDRAPAKGLYILTGSATPSEDVNRHSGAGRIAVIQMRPMSLMESGHSTGHASLKAVLAGDKVTAQDSGLTVPDIIERICIGGWPALLDASYSRCGPVAARLHQPDRPGRHPRARRTTTRSRKHPPATHVTGPQCRHCREGHRAGQGRRRGGGPGRASHRRRIPRLADPAAIDRELTSLGPTHALRHPAAVVTHPLFRRSLPRSRSSRPGTHSASRRPQRDRLLLREPRGTRCPRCTPRGSVDRSTTGETRTRTKSTSSSPCPTDDGALRGKDEPCRCGQGGRLLVVLRRKGRPRKGWSARGTGRNHLHGLRLPPTRRRHRPPHRHPRPLIHHESACPDAAGSSHSGRLTRQRWPFDQRHRHRCSGTKR